MSVVKVKGVEFDFGDQLLVIPPLSLSALEQLQEKLSAFDGTLSSASTGTVVDCVHAALLRNYPDMQRESVSNLLDVGNMMDVMACVMDVSGLKRKAQEAEKNQPRPE
jgi:hypothetical protein